MSETLDAVMKKTGLSRTVLSGQIAVVTGGGRGIGREAALALAWLGAVVVVAELSDQGEEVVQAIHAQGGRACFVRTDVSNVESVAGLAQRIRTEFGPVGILVNNAILCPVAPVVEMDPALWDQVMGVNLRGTFLTCRAFLPEMLRNGSGIIVNMTSTDAMPGLAAYIASKQGIVGFSQSLAVEVADCGVRVIAFAPGMVDTPGIRGVVPELAPRLGLSPEQFLSVSLHPAYQGLMPPVHAGVATAYLVAALADEYHGEVVNGYTILERAGVIAPVAAPGIPAPVDVPSSAGISGRAAVGLRALELSRRLKQVIDETGAEFSRLPLFARPLARSGFKSKAGQSLQDWQRRLESLIAMLEREDEVPSQLDRGQYQEALTRLLGYYEGVPAETARFTRDTEMLNEVTRIAAERVALIRALHQVLEEL